MERKPPRRTRERILELSLRLFNDFGEPNVNTTLISDEMNISPGNLYYHFKNKDDIINCIFQQFEREIDKLLAVPQDRQANVEDAWLFLHVLFELVWKYRFFYRDLNNLLANNRTLEVKFKQLLAQKVKVAKALCEGLQQGRRTAGEPARDRVAGDQHGGRGDVLALVLVRDGPAPLQRAGGRRRRRAARLLPGDGARPRPTSPARRATLFERLAAEYLTD